MAVVGGGTAGVEFAQLFSRMGARVTLLERSQTILAKEDPEIVAHIQRLLVAEGIDIVGPCAITGAFTQGGKKVLELQLDVGRVEVAAEEVMLATGRAPNLEDLGVEAVGLRRGPSGLEVSAQMRTSVPSVFACGDVTGLYLLSHTAEYQARIAAHWRAKGYNRHSEVTTDREEERWP